MVKRRKKKSLKPGSVYAIQLSDRSYAFGVQCVGNEVLFFDFKSQESSLPNNLLSLPAAFRLLVAKDDLQGECWPEVGKVETNEEILEPGRYIHKPVGSPTYFVYCDGNSSPVKQEQIYGLEVFTVWFASHVKSRLESSFKGEKSKYDLAIRKQLGIPVE